MRGPVGHRDPRWSRSQMRDAPAPRSRPRPGSRRVEPRTGPSGVASCGCGPRPRPRNRTPRSRPARARRHVRGFAWRGPRSGSPQRRCDRAAAGRRRSRRSSAGGAAPAALRAAGSGGQLGAALAATRRKDGPAGPRAHPGPEAVVLGPAAVVRLERTLAHVSWLLPCRVLRARRWGGPGHRSWGAAWPLPAPRGHTPRRACSVGRNRKPAARETRAVGMRKRPTGQPQRYARARARVKPAALAGSGGQSDQ